MSCLGLLLLFDLLEPLYMRSYLKMQAFLYNKDEGGWAGEKLQKWNPGHPGCCRTKTTPALTLTPLPHPGYNADDLDEETRQMKVYTNWQE